MPCLPIVTYSSWRMVEYIDYKAAGNSISSQLGSSCQGNRYGTEKASGMDRPSCTKTHMPGHSPPASKRAGVLDQPSASFALIEAAQLRADGIFSCSHIVKVHNRLSWAMSHKEGMARYMLSLWSPIPTPAPPPPTLWIWNCERARKKNIWQRNPMQKPNSCTYNLVEVSGHNLESFQTSVFRLHTMLILRTSFKPLLYFKYTNISKSHQSLASNKFRSRFSQ